MNSNHRICEFVVIFTCVLGAAAGAYNDPPVACYQYSPVFWPLAAFNAGQPVSTSGGNSYDPDNGSPYCCDRGITWHDWSRWATCGTAQIVGYSGATHGGLQVMFNCIGKHYIFQEVTDDDYPSATSDSEQCDVWVFSMDLDMPNNPAGYLGVGDTTDLSPAYAPGNLYAGYKKLSVNAGGYIDVLQNSTPVISGTDKEQSWLLRSGSDPSTLTVKGVSPGQVTLVLEYTPDGQVYPGAQYNGDSVTVTVVTVDKVVKAGTTDEGPLYVVCQDDTIQLQAIPYPSGVFPSGRPSWEFMVKPPGATGTITPSSGSDTVTVSGFNVPGEYVVKARCGSLDDGDEITIMTPPPDSYWELFEPNFACPPREGESNQKCKHDHCGNRLAVYCDNTNSGGFTAYSWWYLPAGATPRGTEVGICVWTGGQNSFRYRVTDETNYGKKRFLETHHATQNDAQGVDGHGEGCNGYWCWRVERYDCVNQSPLGQGVWWRRQTWGPGTTEYQGIPCPGPGGGNGAHPCYPN